MKNSAQEPIKSLGSPKSEDWWDSEAGHEILVLEDPQVRAVFDAKQAPGSIFSTNRLVGNFRSEPNSDNPSVLMPLGQIVYLIR